MESKEGGDQREGSDEISVVTDPRTLVIGETQEEDYLDPLESNLDNSQDTPVVAPTVLVVEATLSRDRLRREPRGLLIF